MRSFSTCADPRCLEPLLQVTWVGQLTHPNCQQTDEEVKLRQFVDAAQRGDDEGANRLEKELNKPSPVVSLGSAALWYASIGWHVFPCAVGDKLPAIPNAHPKGDPLHGKCEGECGKLGHGFYDATTDEQQIRKWWGEADYNIGLRTGINFDVVDQDGPNGVKTLSEWDDLPDIHGKVSTVREDGGMHLYILPTGKGCKARFDRNKETGFPGGLDFRGRGGYCIAPPSRIGSRRYTWLVKPSPEIMGKVNA